MRGADDDASRILRRYLLGLALVAASADLECYLREGCLLRHAGEGDEAWEAVPRRGESTFYTLAPAAVRDYAQQSAAAFGVEQPERRYAFDIKQAKALLAKAEEAESDATAGE